jgi:predicted phage-related endonuclease
MRSDLIITRIPPHTKEWHNFRRNGIGGSEVGDICGLVKREYNRTIYHFHNKVGDVLTEIPDNPKMFFGRYFEDSIANLWRFYDGSEQGFIENYKNNRVIRECRKVNGFVVNPKYPWLFASIDRLMNV